MSPFMITPNDFACCALSLNFQGATEVSQLLLLVVVSLVCSIYPNFNQKYVYFGQIVHMHT